MTKRFCNYEHLGSCAAWLAYRAENYWSGEARRRFGRHAYFCAPHAAIAVHIGLIALPRLTRRYPQLECARAK